MNRLLILCAIALIALCMAVTQHYALLYNWYWTYWWLDMVMHTAGGMVIALSAAVFISGRFVVLILAVLGVGLLWEVFEYAIGVSLREQNFVLDTGLDLSLDLIGGLVAYGIMRMWRKSPLPLRVAHEESPDQTSS